MAINTKDKFNFFVPMTFEKAGDKEGQMRVRGVCSSAVEDADGEILEPNGFDFSPLIKSGFFNYNHRGNKDPGAIIGEPTGARLINSAKEFEVEGFLYPNEQGKATYQLGQTLEKYSPNRRLGWSIEGQVLERDAMNPKRITKARITGVAITPCPKNPNTLVNIVKGDYQEAFVEMDDDGEKEVDDLQKKEAEKAMTVDIDLNPESVESKKRPIEESSRFLKKSDIYEKIISSYPNELEKAEDIYSLIIKTNEKLFNMKSNQVTTEAIDKAFEFLDDSIKKSEEAEEIQNDNIKKSDDNDEEDDEVEKAMQSSCERMVKAGLSKSDAVGKLQQMGIDEAKASFVYDCCIKDANDNKDGNGPVEVAPVNQGAEIAKGIEEKLDSFAKSFDGKFAAIGTLLKAEMEEKESLIEKLDNLQKSYDAVTSDIEKIERNVPPTRKSIAKPVERFAKSEAADSQVRTYNASNARHMRALTDELYAHTIKARQDGHPNERLERAVENLEIAKSTNFNTIWADLKALGIEVIQ